MFIGILITSCDEEDNTGASGINYTDATITVTSAQSSYTFDEILIDEDVPSTFTASISASIAEPQPVDAIVSFVQSSGNADSNDYTVGEIKIPAGATTGSTDIEINRTGNVEGSENFTLKAISDGNFKLASDFTLPVTITDFVDDTLLFSTTWAGEYTFEAAGPTDVTLDFCSIDLDVLLFTSAGAYVQALGATGACTETGSTMEGLPDGDYFVVVEVFANPLLTYALTEPVPLTVNYSQSNSESGSFTSNLFSLASPTGLVAIATITKSGYNFTVTPL